MLKLFFLALFLIHGFINLQREIFANEIISLAGGFFLIGALLQKKLKKKRADHLVVLLLLYGIAIACIGFYFNKSGTTYEKLRTLPFLYSILCFYLGYYILYEGAQQFYNSKIYKPGIIILAGAGAIFGPKITYPVFVTFASGGFKSRTRLYVTSVALITSMLFLKIFAINDGHNDFTILVALLFLIFSYQFKIYFYRLISNKYTALAAFLILASSLLTLKVIHQSWSDFYYYGNEYFSLITDPNTIWRLMFWAKTVGEMNIYQWFFGIGLGTPIFDPNDPASAFIVNSEPNALHRPYTLGLHNSFITIFVRFGVIGIFLLCLIFFKALQNLARIKDLQSEALILTLVMLAIAALFNVVLESPLYSGLFWSILGICYAKANKSEARNKLYAP